MRLGYIDRTEKQTIRMMPRFQRKDLFDNDETTIEYARRFFREINGLGNIFLVKLQGSQYRIIGERYL